MLRNFTCRHNYHTKESILVYCVNEDLLQIDEYVSDTESIYSIISIDDYQEQVDFDNEENSDVQNNLIEQDGKLREGHLDSIEKLELQQMLEHL